MGHLAQTGPPSSQNPGLLSRFSTFPLPCCKGRGLQTAGSVRAASLIGICHQTSLGT